MKHKAAPASRRRRCLRDDEIPPEFVNNAYTLAIRRAARDAHRITCDRDAVECEVCRDHARAVANAKWALNHAINET
jgi:hypothetical protein